MLRMPILTRNPSQQAKGVALAWTGMRRGDLIGE
jgi:hypothetical protein